MQLLGVIGDIAVSPLQNIWLIITDLLVGAAIITALGFAILAIIQWAQRRHFLKIDPELRWALVPFALMGVVYLVFEHLIILARRPNGSGEPSFPSTHVMITATVFFLTIIILPKYVKNRRARLILDILMIAAIVLVAIGRVVANMHWVTDVLGGIGFGGIFAVIYHLILQRVVKNTKTDKKAIPKKGTPDAKSSH